MASKIRYLLILPLFLALLLSCKEDISIPTEYNASDNNELPVNFQLSWPEETGTRAEMVNGIERFSNDDIIHILGTFKIKYLSDDAQDANGYIEDTVTRYGALRYNGKDWEEVAGSELTWPAVALTGTFKAYYISGSTGILTGEKPTDLKTLSLLSETSDPLEAESATYDYGYAVKLEFKHLCAHLTLIDLEPVAADYYWFTTAGPINPTNNEILPFNNAFQISLGDINNPKGPSLNFSFCRMEDFQYTDSDTNPHYYISGKRYNEDGVDSSGNPVTVSIASYFLEPGYYEKFSIVYPASTTSMSVYPYLEYDYTKVPDDSGGVDVTNNPPDLKANTPYTLTITKSPGITINSPTVPEGWDDTGEFFDVDVEEFLRAIYDETEYKNNNNVLILEKTPTGTRLLHNVDFKNERYNFTDGFQPNNMEGSVFDGNYHYIKNLASPLFRYNYGTIENLGIQNVDISLVSYESADSKPDMSRTGALCMWNRENAKIMNARVTDVNLTVYIKGVDTEGQETHNVGGVVGSNTGTIDLLELSGNFNISVTGLKADTPDFGNGIDYPVNVSVLIGGIMGQNAAEGTVSDVSAYGGQLSIKIVNNCVGNIGSYSSGGIAGESSGFIKGVILPNLNLDCTGSKGVTSYIGGLTGKLEATGGADLSSCNVSGSVRAGVSSPFGFVSSASYIGGISGTVNNVSVSDCRPSVSVYAATEALTGVLYGTGEVFGRIRRNDNGNYDYENINAYGNYFVWPKTPAILPEGETVTNYYGTFAGIAPEGQSWESNYTDKNIIVRTYTGLEHIGGNID